MTRRSTTINGYQIELSMPDSPMAAMDLAVAEIILELAVERGTQTLDITDEVASEIERRLVCKGYRIDGSRIN